MDSCFWAKSWPKLVINLPFKSFPGSCIRFCQWICCLGGEKDSWCFFHCCLPRILLRCLCILEFIWHYQIVVSSLAIYEKCNCCIYIHISSLSVCISCPYNHCAFNLFKLFAYLECKNILCAWHICIWLLRMKFVFWGGLLFITHWHKCFRFVCSLLYLFRSLVRKYERKFIMIVTPRYLSKF